MNNFVLAAMIHDSTHDKWHPVIFRDAPLPGPDRRGKPRRLKSVGHHTTGFPDRTEAETWLKAMHEHLPYDNTLFPWDGAGVPALVVFCDEEGTRIIG